MFSVTLVLYHTTFRTVFAHCSFLHRLGLLQFGSVTFVSALVWFCWVRYDLFRFGQARLSQFMETQTTSFFSQLGQYSPIHKTNILILYGDGLTNVYFNLILGHSPENPQAKQYYHSGFTHLEFRSGDPTYYKLQALRQSRTSEELFYLSQPKDLSLVTATQYIQLRENRRS